MVNTLVLASDMDANTVKKKLLHTTDVWLNATEMIELGLADYVLEEI